MLFKPPLLKRSESPNLSGQPLWDKEQHNAGFNRYVKFKTNKTSFITVLVSTNSDIENITVVAGSKLRQSSL